MLMLMQSFDSGGTVDPPSSSSAGYAGVQLAGFVFALLLLVLQGVSCGG